MTGPQVLNFGCRLNAYEAEVMRGLAPDASGAIIVNTCAVTAEAERQARQAIRRLRRERPDAQIVVTGCAAQLDPAKYAALPEVDRVVGNIEKMAAETWCGDHPEAIEVTDIMAVRETAAHLVGDFEGRARAFVEVQQGCDHRCTFCIIPFARGNNRSVPVGGIVEQVRRLVENGFREEATLELTDARRTFRELSQRVRTANDNLRRTVIRAPVDGTIKTLYLVTVYF